jgi:hypothetical protein
MAHAAICPKCSNEFDPTGPIADGETAECPACGATFALDENFISLADESSSSNIDPQATVEERLDASQLHIDNWLLSKSNSSDILSKLEDVPTPQKEQKESAATVSDLSATIEIPSSHTPEKEIELQTSEDVEDRPTWDDPEHMERLLSEIDPEPVDDYLPVAHDSQTELHTSEDDGHVLEDDLGETVEYSPSDYGRLDLERLELRHADAEDEIAADSVEDEETFTPSERPKRRRSRVRALIGAAVAAPIGLLGGYLVLLWISGPSADFFNLAQFFPSAILPQSMQAKDSAQPNVPSSLLDQLEVPPPAQFADVPADTLPAPPEAVSTSVGQTESASSPERQASFDAPAPTSPPLPIANDDRYADAVSHQTPIAADAPPADPLLSFPATPVAAQASPKIAGAPSYSSDQLATTLAAAREARHGLIAGSLNDQTVMRTKGLSYSKLAELAEVLTFADVQNGAASAATSPSPSVAMFAETLAQPRIREEVARIVPVWIGSPHRRHGGIFFAGTIVSRTQQGPLVECKVALDVATSLTVIAAADLVDRLPSDGPIAVVGSLVDRPAERIEGYSGGATQAVWATSLVPLDR